MAKGKKNKKEVVEESDEGSPMEQDSEDEVQEKKTSKNKKGKKEAKPKKPVVNSDEEEEEEEKPKPKAKKDKKKKVVVESDEDESEDEAPVVQKSGFALLMGDDDDDDDDSDSEPEAPVVSSKKSAFAMLADDSDGDSDEDKESEDEKPVIIKKGKQKPKAPVEEDNDGGKGGKKGKKKKKKKDDDDEDLDKMLEELKLEYAGQKAPGIAGVEEKSEEKKDKKKKKKGKDKDAGDDLDEMLEIIDGEEVGGTVKTAAQKKKEKKERQKQKMAGQKGSEKNESEEPSVKAVEKEEVKKEATPEAENEQENEGEGDDKKGKKKKKKKGDKAEEEEKKKGKKPGGKTLAAMQELLKQQKEEAERLEREEEERIAREEEAERQRLEKKRLEEEKKALKKQREKEKREQQKKDGTYLTKKQKEEKARAEAKLAALRAQGVVIPDGTQKKAPLPGRRPRKPKPNAKSQSPEVEEKSVSVSEEKSSEQQPEEEVSEVTEPPKEEEKKEDAPEAWDASDDDAPDEWDVSDDEPAKTEEKPKQEAKKEEVKEDSEGSYEEESDDESEEDSDEDESDSEESEDEHSKAEIARAKALDRIKKRRELNEKNRTTDVLRAPVVCVLGHVDTGKTKILDKLRRTNVQDGEAGGITQQIGATNVPIDVIKEQCKMIKDFDKDSLKLPGLLIIDTPGHESFSNLRDRGSSLCDIAILVVDIMHCLEPQTIESITMLKKKKVPFVIALNKIDRLYEWKSNRHKDVSEVVASQSHNTKLEFQKRAQEVVVAMAEQGLNAALFYENPDPKTYISMVPTSAHTGEGMGNLMGLLVHLSQTMLAKRLSFTEELQATVLEVKAIPGLGTTIDIVLVNGTLKEGQTMVVAGTEGPIVTQIKALLTPAKMQDLRVKNTYVEHKVLRAAQGVKIAAKELEKAIAGLNLLVATQHDEIEICREEIAHELQSALNAIKVKALGVFVQASTLGSLEALLEFLKTSKIPYAGVKIGPVVKRDVMKASIMLEHEEKYAVILAFDVKVERDAQEMADHMNVKIFQADIIYHLFDRFTEYQEELKRQKRDEFKHVAVFPCKLRVMPQNVFNSRDPIVCGVVVEAGVIKTGTPMCVPSKEFLEIGICTSIQINHKEMETARKGDEVCVKIEPIPGESPKMFGRHFDEKDLIVSKISRQSIDACKDYFRDDLQKSDWQLMVELKKVFQIL